MVLFYVVLWLYIYFLCCLREMAFLLEESGFSFVRWLVGYRNEFVFAVFFLGVGLVMELGYRVWFSVEFRSEDV